MPTKRSLSVIRIFEQVRTNIAAIDVFPLTPDAIKVNKDELEALGDDEVESGYAFARVATDFPESNSALTFAVDFLNTGIVFTIMNLEPLWRDYSELGTTDTQVSQLIIDTLICLANGQLAMLVTLTEDDDRLQAFELLYRHPGRTRYDAICTAANFQSARKLKGREYKTDVFINKAKIDPVSLNVAKTQFLLMSDSQFAMMRSIGRKNISGLHEPLTREIFNKNVDAYAEKVGQKVADTMEYKVDQAFDVVEKKIGVQGKSFWEQAVHFAKWRHIELMFWSLSLLLCPYLINANTNVYPGVILLAGALVALFVFRKKYPYPQILYVLAPVAYVLFVVGLWLFVGGMTSHWLAWVIGIGAFVALIENIFFDARAVMSKIRQ